MQLFFPEGQPLCKALGMRPGVTALVGGGGKTSAMMRLATELSGCGSVVVTTTTHIWPPEPLPVLCSPSQADIRAALDGAGAVCVGTLAHDGKLTACGVAMEVLRTLADYVLVEADGAKGMPLKAPAAHEPVIPACADCVIAVAGLDGLGRSIHEAVFRPERYAALLGVGDAHVVTPRDVARVLCSDDGQHKNVRADMRFCVLLNKADDAAREKLARAVCAQLDERIVERAVVAQLSTGACAEQ